MGGGGWSLLRRVKHHFFVWSLGCQGLRPPNHCIDCSRLNIMKSSLSGLPLIQWCNYTDLTDNHFYFTPYRWIIWAVKKPECYTEAVLVLFPSYLIKSRRFTMISRLKKMQQHQKLYSNHGHLQDGLPQQLYTALDIGDQKQKVSTHLLDVPAVSVYTKEIKKGNRVAFWPLC